MADYLGLRRLTDDQWMEIAADRGVPEELRQPDLLAPLSVQLAAQGSQGSGEAHSTDDGSIPTLSEIMKMLNK